MCWQPCPWGDFTWQLVRGEKLPGLGCERHPSIACRADAHKPGKKFPGNWAVGGTLAHKSR